MSLRLIILIAAVATGLTVGRAEAQPLSGQTSTNQTGASQTGASRAAAASPSDVSMSHSALKAATFKVGTIVTNLGLLSAATGGVVAGTVLTAIDTAASMVVYTANDYLWDSYDPPPVKQAVDQSLDKADEAWRTTRKFLTFKPAVIAISWGLIYAYTGSATTMMVFGTASTLTKSALFYINNFAWDAYDWRTAKPVAAPGP
jgi:uncharacterized membrane protein